MEITLENYEFKKAMQMLINDNVNPILIANNFKKYKKNNFVREMNELAQIISFSVRKNDLKAFAYFWPIFVPCDTFFNYGIELTGTTGCRLLSGRYFTTIYERGIGNLESQFENFHNQHKLNFEKLVNAIKDGVLPEMNRIDSLGKFMAIVDDEEENILGNKYGKERRKTIIDDFIYAVYECLTENYYEGRKKLFQVKQYLDNVGLKYEDCKKIYEVIQCLLSSLEDINGETKKKFEVKYNLICTEMRKKYKLVK